MNIADALMWAMTASAFVVVAAILVACWRAVGADADRRSRWPFIERRRGAAARRWGRD